ncbi:MAG: hypothetical protein FK730_00715 [Asgard group archaeon]|nr:hypothetical protein [Asgard group archaeon]
MNYGYYIAIGFVAAIMVVFLIIIIFRMVKRKQRISGEKIEQSIDDKLSSDFLLKRASFYANDKKYSHAIIYLFYVFKIYCEKKYNIKNAKSIDHNELIKKLAGFGEVSIFELKKILKIYEKARFSKDENTFEEFIKTRSFISNFMQNI